MTSSRSAVLTSRWFGQSSFGEFTLATARNVAKVDKDPPLELLGPLGCGVRTGAGAVLKQLRLAAGESIVIFGVGAVGLSAVLTARLSGASEIVAVDLSPARRDLALELAATRDVDGADPDLARLARRPRPLRREPGHHRDQRGDGHRGGCAGPAGSLARHPDNPSGDHVRPVGDLRLRGGRRPLGLHPSARRPVAARPVPVRPAHPDLPVGRDQPGRGGRGVRRHDQTGAAGTRPPGGS